MEFAARSLPLAHALSQVAPSPASPDPWCPGFLPALTTCDLWAPSGVGSQGEPRCGAVSMGVHWRPHLGVAYWGAVRRGLPSQEAVSRGRAHLQTGAEASSEGSRSAGAPWTSDTARPWAPGAGGGQNVRAALLLAGSLLPCARPPAEPTRSDSTTAQSREKSPERCPQ